MDNALFVGVLQRVADLDHNPLRLLRMDGLLLDQSPQGHAIDILHEQVEKSASLTEIENADDVGMVELGQGLRLAGETMGKGRVAPQFR